MLDKLHFASAEANSMSKQANYKMELARRKDPEPDDFSIVGKCRVRMSDLSSGNNIKVTYDPRICRGSEKAR